ncbi:MAG: TAXI family TRAP transporter solute-binding subunit [Polaromonas sp.]|nr:TAXI family TRAP transporter solute-binding subunit [Polaromonas sp.]
MKLLRLYRRRWSLFYLPLLLGTLAALWWAQAQWRERPPMQVVISAGSPQGSYALLAQRYAERLERQGLSVEIVYSDTQKAALDRLLKTGDATIGFAQGIYASTDTPLQALGVIGQEPVWVFSAASGASSLAQARGLRIAVGPEESSTYLTAEAMLAHAGLKMTDIVPSLLSGLQAAQALQDGKLDMMFEAASEESQSVQLLTRNSAIQLLGAENAGALAVRQPALQPVLVPQGSMELRGDIPPRDLTLLSLQTHAVVRPDVHPALQRAVLDASADIHEFPGFLQRHGQFPSFRGSDFPLSAVARDYSQGSRPWLEGLLPYGTAQWAELLFYAVFPILLLAILLLAWIPRIFDWRIKAALHNFYGELKFLENEMTQIATDSPMKLRSLLEKLDRIEQQVIALDLPAEYSDRWYTLREHLAADRERLLRLRAR